MHALNNNLPVMNASYSSNKLPKTILARSADTELFQCPNLVFAESTRGTEEAAR